MGFGQRLVYQIGQQYQFWEHSAVTLALSPSAGIGANPLSPVGSYLCPARKYWRKLLVPNGLSGSPCPCAHRILGIPGSPYLSEYLPANPSQSSAAQSSTMEVAIAGQTLVFVGKG